jgi:tetratricopeptide (TPR) repeat protein
VTGDLDRLFDRRRTSPIVVREAFTDREREAEAFDRALHRLAGEPDAVAADRPDGRGNLLVFHGIGGVGKSTLSAALQARLTGGDDGEGPRRLACRVNFEDGVFTDPETLLLHVRGELGRQVRSWPAFDLALAAYWERRHPGEPMQPFLERNSALRRTSAAVGLPEQLQATADALVGGVPFAGLVWRATGTLAAAMRDRLRRGRLLADCRVFADLVQADAPDRMLPYLPALLSWDLARLRAERPTDLVLFLDTFEHVDGRRGDGRAVEDAVARLVYLLPNALVVVTGRNRLRWGDARRPQIHFSGPDYWPALRSRPAPGVEPMQHRLSGLPAADCHAYLGRRLVRDDRPAIPPAVADRIVAASAGLPLYLDLSTQYFDQLAATGAEPEPARFGGTFPEVVVRLMKDLDAVDRRLLRAAALAGWFDRAVLAAAVPGAGDAAVDRFLDRDLVRRESGGWLPYALDEPLREAIRRHDRETDDAWSEREWGVAARGVLDHLAAELAADVEDPTETDRSRVVQGFTVAARVAVECGEVPDWLYRAAYAVRLLGLPAVLEAPAAPRAPGHPATPFLLTCAGMARRQQERHDQALALFGQALRHPAGTPFGRLFVTHRLGKTLEEAGRIAEAEPLLEQVAAVDGPDRPVAEKDLARLRLLRGDPRDALAWGERHRASPLPVRRAQALDLLGWTSLLAGDFAAAEDRFRAILDDQPLARAGLSRDTAGRHLALVVCWVRPEDGLRIAAEALRVNAVAGNLTGMAQAHTAAAVSLAGTGGRAEALGEAARATELLRRAGNLPELWFPLLAELFCQAVTGSAEAVDRAAAALTGHLAAAGLHPALAEVAAAWAAERGWRVRTAPPPAVWPDRERGLEAWREVLRRRMRAAGR